MQQTSYFLRRSSSMWPDRLAVVSGDTELTYCQLNKVANKWASALKAYGIHAGSHIVYVVNNSAGAVTIWEATQKIGVCAVPLNTRLDEKTMTDMLMLIEAQAVIFDSKNAQKTINVLRSIDYQGLVISLESEQGASCCEMQDISGTVFDEEAFLLMGTEDEIDADYPSNTPSLILFTSGTTDKPKAVLRTRQMVFDISIVQMIENRNLDGTLDVMYSQNPHYHYGGIILMLKMCALGGTLITEARFDPKRAAQMIEHYRATQVFMIPPTLFTQMFLSKVWQDHDLSSVRQAQCSAGASSCKISEAVFQMFPNTRFRVSYGASESGSPTSASFTQEQLVRRPELASSIGRLNANVEMRLVSDSGRPCKTGEVGEALVRSSVVFAGYIGQPELTLQAFEQEGWLHTEDLMRKDEEDYYFLVGRSRDIVKSGGENVYAQEVERCLNEFPSIVDSAVIGMPDEWFGEVVAAAIVLDHDTENIDIKGLLEFCESKMPSYMKPRYLARMEKLPTNSIGKIQKSELRACPELFKRIR